jgi:hypothetical protein
MVSLGYWLSDANSIMYDDSFGRDIPTNMLRGLKLIANNIAPLLNIIKC